MNPKDRFNTTPQSKVFADIAVSEPFLLALDYAMLELQAILPQDSDPSKGWDAHSRLVGAGQLVRILKSLAFPSEADKETKNPTLNYAAYNRPARASKPNGNRQA